MDMFLTLTLQLDGSRLNSSQILIYICVEQGSMAVKAVSAAQYASILLLEGAFAQYAQFC